MLGGKRSAPLSGEGEQRIAGRGERADEVIIAASALARSSQLETPQLLAVTTMQSWRRLLGMQRCRGGRIQLPRPQQIGVAPSRQPKAAAVASPS